MAGDWSEIKARQVASAIAPAAPAPPRKKKKPPSNASQVATSYVLQTTSPQVNEPLPSAWPSAKALGKRKRREAPARTPRLDDSDSD